MASSAAQSDEPDDRQYAYERTLSFIRSKTVERDDRYAIRETQLRLHLDAHGPLDSDQIDTALTMLEEHDLIVRGGGWLTVRLDTEWHRRVIGRVLEAAGANDREPPQDFIGALNTASDAGRDSDA